MPIQDRSSLSIAASSVLVPMSVNSCRTMPVAACKPHGQLAPQREGSLRRREDVSSLVRVDVYLH
jgi:hypothetical protein